MWVDGLEINPKEMQNQNILNKHNDTFDLVRSLSWWSLSLGGSQQQPRRKPGPARNGKIFSIDILLYFVTETNYSKKNRENI